MCGICGFLSKREITLEQLRTMNDTMYHRGPNDSGEEMLNVAAGFTLGMAQRRLSIMDLSMLGHQPMHSKDNRLIISYNGEIYNFLELREQLKDYPFRSHCDTEVILAAYLKWGLDCVDKFEGMFAISLFDCESWNLYLMRDRIGKKPLYYWKEKEQVVFASELKPIMMHPDFKKEIRQDVLKSYLFHQCIHEPNSIFQNVYKVEPGQIISFHIDENKQTITEKKRKYWDIATVHAKKRKETVGTYEEAKEELKHILQESVRKRMIADVPLGTFLSGGYDSSLVTAIAQSISKEPVKTYSIGFLDEKYNEAKYAKEVAQYLGTQHTEMYISEKQMFELVDSLPQCYDEPFADSSQIPSMLVSELASKNVTVVLSGDGGDEFFCGYNMYDYIATAQKLDPLGNIVYGVTQLPFFKKKDLMSRLPFQVQVVADNHNNATKTQIGGSPYRKAIDQMVISEGIAYKFEIEEKYQEKNWQERRMLLDEETYLPGDILCKVDRASMKYSIEARCPILDVNVMEYSYRLPHEYKYANGVKKRILKDIAYDYMPKELLDRPKVGFAVPLDSWMRGPLKEQLLDMCQKSYLEKQGLFHAEYMQKMVQEYLLTGDKGPRSGGNYSKIMWAYFAFQQWYQHYII